MTTGVTRSKKPIARLVVYYLALVMVVLLLRELLPDVYDLLAKPASMRGLSLDGPSEPTGPLTEDFPGLTTAIVIVGALAVMLPVAWVYMMTKQLEGYDRSVVQTLIVLPTAICGVVVIVQNSVALAFSLAGIVAAVRFRNTLKDTKDAVYIFLAIGVGLAAGVQNLHVAFVISLIFNLTILALWRTNFGNIYANQGGGVGAIPTGQALTGVVGGGGAVGGTGGGASATANPDLLAAMTPDELERLAERSQRLRQHIRARQGLEKEKRPNAVLLVHATDAVAAQPLVEAILETHTKIWKLIEILPADAETTTMEYLIRARKSLPAAALLDRLKTDCAPHVVAVEFQSLKGLK